MSNKVYNEYYALTRKNLKSLLKVETPTQPETLIFDREVALQNAVSLYLSYIKVANALNTCYSQMLHPQKRPFIKILLEGAIGRVLELKEELVQLEFTEIQFLDNTIGKFQLLPHQLELEIPEHFINDKTEEQKENNIWISNAFKAKEVDSCEIDISECKDMSIDEAVLTIQIHERSCQAKKAIVDIKKQRELEAKEIRRYGKKKPKPNISENEAAILIQTMWRGFSARKFARLDREEEKIFLGMFPDYSNNKKRDPLKIMGKIIQKCQQFKEEEQSFYESAVTRIHDDIDQNVVPGMKEKTQDEIRDYFHSFKKVKDEFPIFPTEQEGGSLVFFRKETIVPVVELAKGKKDKGKDKQKDNGKKGDKKKEVEVGFKLKPSKHIPEVQEGVTQFEKLWKIKPKDKIQPFEFDPEQFNPLTGQALDSENCDEIIIRKKLMKEFQLTVRQQVDEIMRNELKLLTEALEKDKGKRKGKKGKGKKGKGKKGGKGKGGKKGKKEKDLTPNRTFEDLIDELVQQDILKQYPKVRLSEIIGSHSYIGSVVRKEFNKEPDPGILDIRRVVKEFCVFPMGSASIHSKGPFTKSLLFAGPHGVGKSTFVHAICTEIGATMFDLSAENIVGKYPGTSGLNMLIHLMSKVGKRVQPTVIFIKDAEKTFMKKVPKTDTTDPKRLKKVLPKFVKAINADLRILILGTTCLPFDVDLKGLGGCYQKVLYLRHPAHNCRMTLWKEMILRHSGVISLEFDISTLCKVSEGYTPLHIRTIVEKVLTARRIAHQKKCALSLSEFTSLLSLFQPVYSEEHEAYQAWLKKMPLGRKREKMLKGDQDDGKGKNKKKK